jgi:hypothetical protein
VEAIARRLLREDVVPRGDARRTRTCTVAQGRDRRRAVLPLLPERVRRRVLNPGGLEPHPWSVAQSTGLSLMLEWGCECVWEGMSAKVKKTQIRCLETAAGALRKDSTLCGRQGAGEGVSQTLQRHQLL